MKFRPFYNMLALALLTSPSLAYGASTPARAFIGKGQAMIAPRGFVAMCQRDKAACGSETADVKAKPANSDAQWPYQSATGAIGCDGVSGEYRHDLVSATLTQVSPLGTNCAPQPSRSTTNQRSMSKGPSTPTLARDREIVIKVNQLVNGRVRQRTDRQIFGIDEYWTRSTLEKAAQGDCEDLALEKRHELIERGFDPQRMFLAVVYRRQIGLHTILVARLDDGDFVLDSRTPYVERWTDTAYSWVVVQDAADPQSWYKPIRNVQVATAMLKPLNP